MAQRKVYESIHFHIRDLYVLVDGKPVLIQFRGGSMIPDIKGRFSTTDPKLIKAMDTDSAYGKSFKCIHVEDYPDPVPSKENVLAGAKTEGGNSPANESGNNTDGSPANEGDFTKVEGIKTVQKAKEYLAAEPYNIPLSQLPNGTVVKAKAKELKLLFVDLQ